MTESQVVSIVLPVTETGLARIDVNYHPELRYSFKEHDMNLNNSMERIIKFALDECLPPILRDSKFFMWLPFKVAFGSKAHYFFNFKEQVASISDESISDIYSQTGSVQIQENDTDLGRSMIREIDTNISGESLLDVGCGKGVLAKRLSKKCSVTACDILIDPKTVNNLPQIDFRKASIENLPFGDGEFDTVTCTHTLEHIRDVSRAVKELKRVAGKRLIVVVPKERPYRYTFSLHVNFFPFKYQLLQLFHQNFASSTCTIKEIDGCWYYQEDVQ
ncbi:MAG: class I SAM-dependent methyltransferase [Candidatus Sabulitectum sp.]|nr:class I SAM-dependent methyltransferase [Candidatus Sabulitectum sp.]